MPIAYQSWRHVSFLHWRYERELIQRMMPEGLTPDLVDGSAWVGVTPFQVEGFRLPATPALPVVSKFPETNLRKYVVDGDGTDGLWFFSLDVESAVMVAAARLGLNLPYFPAKMAGRVRGARRRTTVAADACARPLDLVERSFRASRPKPCTTTHWPSLPTPAWEANREEQREASTSVGKVLPIAPDARDW